MKARSLLALVVACAAVFGASFGGARVAREDDEGARARPVSPQATPPARPALQRPGLDAAPGLPPLRERRRPKRGPIAVRLTADRGG